MNYIKQLQEDRLNAAKKLANILLELEAFNVHLHSEKFTGVQSDGTRKDWISTADVINRIREIKSLI